MTPATTIPRVPPSEAQMRVLRFIAVHQQIAGKPPTFREHATHLGVVSVNAVNDLVQALLRKGWLARAALAPVNASFIDAHAGIRGQRTNPYRLTEDAMALIFGPPCAACAGTGRRATQTKREGGT